MIVLIVLAEKCCGKRLLRPVLPRHTENFTKIELQNILCPCDQVYNDLQWAEFVFTVINTWTLY